LPCRSVSSYQTPIIPTYSRAAKGRTIPLDAQFPIGNYIPYERKKQVFWNFFSPFSLFYAACPVAGVFSNSANNAHKRRRLKGNIV
jgi:hypothetical protein